MPEWVTTAYEDYTRRMGSAMRIDLEEIPVGRAKADEEKKLLERIGDDYLVALDERGKSLTTLQLAKWLGERQQDGRDLTFVIGGPDGHGPGLLVKGKLRWSLSKIGRASCRERVWISGGGGEVKKKKTRGGA